MTVLCPSCRRAIRIPPEKVGVANLRAKCAGCQTVFAVAEASIAPEAPAPSSAVPPPPANAPNPPALPVAHPPAARTAATPATAPTPAAPGTTGSTATRAATSPTGRPAVAAPAPGGAPTRTPARAPSWRRCANHSQARSETYCPSCKKGLCHDCSKAFQNAFICPDCDGLCVTAADQEARETRERERSRPLREDLEPILRYPLVDPIAYVLLAIFVWGFRVAGAIAAFGGGFGALFSQGLLMAYAFTAVNRVSAGNSKSFMPSISDIADLIVPVRLGFAALVISAGPLLALLFLMPVTQTLGLSTTREVPALLETAHAQEPPPGPPAEPASPGEAAGEEDAEEADEAGPDADAEATPEPGVDSLLLQQPEEAALAEEPLVPVWGWVLVVLAFAWNLAYAPVALTVAAISQSFLQTLNPLIGIDTIRRMGGVYWQAMGYYTAITAVQLLLGFGLELIPILGGIGRAFVDSWALLSIGCLLGRAVFKRAAELGLD